MNFSHWSVVLGESQTQLGTESIGIPRRAFQAHAQAGFAPHVMEQLCLGSVLAYNQINPSVAVVIANGAPALLSIHEDTAFLSRYRGKGSLTVAA
jgi:hypothetical protein